MYDISYTRIGNELLPKISREYNITPEENRDSSRIQTNHRDSNGFPPFISTGLFSPLFSNNNINLSSSPDSSKNSKKKEEERTSPNYLQWIITASITAIATAFGLGRLRSSIAEAEENILLSRKVFIFISIPEWRIAFQSNQDIVTTIREIFETYHNAETNRKDKLVNYQNSLLGIACGTAVGIIGVCCTQPLIANIGLITGVVAVTFGTYQMAIHWDDFTTAQNKFRDLNLTQVIHQINNPLPLNNPLPSAPPLPV